MRYSSTIRAYSALLLWGGIVLMLLVLPSFLWTYSTGMTRTPYAPNIHGWTAWGSRLVGCCVLAGLLYAPSWITERWFGRRLGWRRWIIPGVTLGLMVVDSYSAHLTRWLILDYAPSDKISEEGGKILSFLKHFGGGYGIVLTGVLIGVLDSWRRATRFWIILIIVGLTCTPLKIMTGRERPIRPGDQEFYPLLPVYVHGPLPSLTASRLHSFPSGHTMTAVAMAAMLCWYYPSGKLVFIVLATGTILHRWYSGAHYFSDSFYGGILGYFLAGVGMASQWTDRSSRWVSNKVNQRKKKQKQYHSV